MEFISTYAKAETLTEKMMCFIAKILRAKVITPLGRIILLPDEYARLAIETGNCDLIE